MHTAVPESEISVEYARSSGPGGQNVNKRSTKAVLHWNVGASAVFTEAQKADIMAAAGKRLNEADEIVLSAEDERSQSQNRDNAVARLQELVDRALAPRKVRRPIKVSRTQKAKRLGEKRILAQKKSTRRRSADEW